MKAFDIYRRATAATLTCIAAMVMAGGCSHRSTNTDDDRQGAADSVGIPDTLRVATLYSPTSFFIYRDERMGYDYDVLQSLASDHGFEVDLQIAPTLATAVEWLDSGKVDLIAYEVPVTDDYRDKVIACGEERVTTQVLVQPRNSSQYISDVTELVGRDIYVEQNSKYHQRLQNLDKELGGGIAIHPIEADTLIAEDLIEMVADGKIPLTVVDSDIAKLNRTYFPGLDISVEISLDQRAAWGVAPTKPWLADSINAWLAEATPRSIRAELLRRYFELSKSELSVYNVDFKSGHISKFDNLFKNNAKGYDWDWRLLAAQAFVESRFDASQVSWAGARGIMQIMPATARAYGVSADALIDNNTSVNLSLKIIKKLSDALASKVPDMEERRKFILAAYNSGIAHIYDAIALAEVTGHNPRKWSGNVEAALLLKSNPEYYNNPVCRYGYFRGRETTEYVRSVMDFYNKAKKSIKP